MATSDAEAPVIPFHFIAEGCGGTITTGDISYVGTYGCKTCVGIYLPLKDSSRCFVAHINACFDIGSSKKPWARRCVGDHEGPDVRHWVGQWLRLESGAQRWKAEDVDQSKIVVVCPAYRRYRRSSPMYRDRHNTNPEDWRPTGHFVVLGLQDFLQNDSICPDESSQGFVVDHQDQSLTCKISKDLSRTDRDAGWLEKVDGDGNDAKRDRKFTKDVCHGLNEQRAWDITLGPDRAARKPLDIRCQDGDEADSD